MRVCELEAECAMRRTIFGLGLVADVETKAGVSRYGPQEPTLPADEDPLGWLKEANAVYPAECRVAAPAR